MAVRSRKHSSPNKGASSPIGEGALWQRMTEAPSAGTLTIFSLLPYQNPSNGQRCDIAGIRIIDGVGVMLADRTKFSGNPPAGPQQLDAMTGAAFWTNAFR